MQDPDALPEPVITEEVDLASLDEWVPDFTNPRPSHVRLDSRRWLLLPERYVYRPLAAMEAFKAADQLTATKVIGKALIGAASRLRAQRQGIESMLRGDEGLAELGEDELQEQVDLRMRDLAQVTFEEVVGETGIEAHAWALSWIEKCQVHRCPLPSKRAGPDADPGGFVHSAKGAGAYPVYYAGRQTHLLRLGAACAWGSLGPLLVDLS